MIERSRLLKQKSWVLRRKVLLQMYNRKASPLPSPCPVLAAESGARNLLHRPLCVASLAPGLAPVLRD